MAVRPKLGLKRIILFLILGIFVAVVVLIYRDVSNSAMARLDQPQAVVATVDNQTSEAATPPVVPDSILEDFENGLGVKWYREMTNSDYSGAASPLYFKEGTLAYRIELRKTDPNLYDSKRSEIALINPELPLEEHTYAFSMLLPKGGEEDYAMDSKGGGEVLATWQNLPDRGEEWTRPSLALHSHKGRYFLEQNWDEAEISTDQQIMSKGHHLEHDLGFYEEDKGQFVTWTFHVKWGWLKSQNPILEVYKGGVKVLDLNGLPNTTNDQAGVYMKLGINKWNWAQPGDKSLLTRRVVYYDSVSIK